MQLVYMLKKEDYIENKIHYPELLHLYWTHTFPKSSWSLDRKLCHVVTRNIIKQDFCKTLENAFFIDVKLQSKIEVILKGWYTDDVHENCQVFKTLHPPYFQYQLIYFVWLSSDFFWFSWSLTIYFFVALYSFVCSCPEISPNVFCI